MLTRDTKSVNTLFNMLETWHLHDLLIMVQLVWCIFCSFHINAAATYSSILLFNEATNMHVSLDGILIQYINKPPIISLQHIEFLV